MGRAPKLNKAFVIFMTCLFGILGAMEKVMAYEIPYHQIVQTGDVTDTSIYFIIAGLAVLGIIGMLIYKRRQKKEEE